MTVITISRQFGSGGDEIAARVCDMLKYKMFDKYLISHVAHEVGLSEPGTVDYTEQNHKVRSFLDRLFGRSSPVVTAYFWKENADGETVLEEREVLEETAVPLVEKAIRSAAQVGNIVILGRGGQSVLRDAPGVVHIRIEAPLEERIQTFKQQIKAAKGEFYADIDARREAQDMITRRDEASRDYLQEYYGVNWNDHSLYHLVLNTAMLTVEQAAQLIVSLVHIFEAQEQIPA